MSEKSGRLSGQLTALQGANWVFDSISKAANAIAHVYQRLESVKLEDGTMAHPNLDQPPEVIPQLAAQIRLSQPASLLLVSSLFITLSLPLH